MEVIFLNSFKKDLKKINDSALKSQIKEIIIELENASSIFEIINVKKLSGFNISYRIKLGNYRLGFYFYSFENKVVLARFVKRNDIYKIFPNKKKDKQ